MDVQEGNLLSQLQVVHQMFLSHITNECEVQHSLYMYTGLKIGYVGPWTKKNPLQITISLLAVMIIYIILY